MRRLPPFSAGLGVLRRGAKTRRPNRREISWRSGTRLLFEPLEQRRLLAADATVGVVLSEPGEVSDGYTLFSPSRGRETYLIDNVGRVVNSWQSNFAPGLTSYLAPDGSLYRSGVSPNNAALLSAPGVGGLLQKFDWDGNLVWDYEYSTSTEVAHHDIEVLPNGNVLLIVWQFRSGAEAIANGRIPSTLSDGYLIPESIIEVQQTGLTTGDVVWRWNVWDHLVQDYDATKANFGSVSANPQLINLNYNSTGPGKGAVAADWNHANGIDYNADLDQIILSVREYSEFWVIDHSTTTAEAAGDTGGRYGNGGDLLYRWGNPRAYKGGTRSDQRLFYQHDAEWIEEGKPGAGNIIVFNNGTNRRDGSNYSSVDEIQLPSLANGSYDWAGSVSVISTIVGTPRGNFYAPITSGQTRLENGNTLIAHGPRGVFSEVTPDSEVVWQYVNPVTSPLGPLTQGQTPGPFNVLNIPGIRANLTFKAEHYAPTYAGLAGRDLTPGSRVELYPDSPPILFGNIDATPTSGSDSEEYIELVNGNAVSVDISGWKLTDAVDFIFPLGTVIPPSAVLYVVADRQRFEGRATGPGGGLNLLIQGDYSGDLSSLGETIVLSNDRDEEVSRLTYLATTVPPQIQPIENQQVTSGTTTDPIAIIVDDPDTPPSGFRYFVVAETLPYILDRELQLDAPRLGSGGVTYFQNYRGQDEKYLIRRDGIHPTNKWYYLLPSGDLYRFTGELGTNSPQSLRGEWIANVGSEVHADPSLLHGAQARGVAATFAFSGNVPNEVTVSPSQSFVGDIPITVTVQDGARKAYASFVVNVVESNNLAPQISPIANVGTPGLSQLTVPIVATDPDSGPEPLSIDVQVSDWFYSLDQQYQWESYLVANRFLPYYESFRGAGEKYLLNPEADAPTRWFYILPSGDLYQFTGNVSSASAASLTGDFIANVGQAAYDDPSLLQDAVQKNLPISAQLSGIPIDTVTLNAASGFNGIALVTVNASDGRDVATESFLATFELPPTLPPVLDPIAAQQVIAGGMISVPLSVIDGDTPSDDLVFTIQTSAVPPLNEVLGSLQAPIVGGGFAAYYQNYRGAQEKYLLNPSADNANRWYYVLPNGDLFRFTGAVGSSSPSSLTGELVVNVGAQAYQDPTLIASIQLPSLFEFTGSPVDALKITAPENFQGTVELVVSVSDGNDVDSQTFELTVQPNTSAAPMLTGIGDQTLRPNAPISVALVATDADTPADNLVFDATVKSLAGDLNETLNLSEPNSGAFPAYYQNYRGAQEKYLLNPDGVNPNRWYYLLPNGDLYRFTGSPASSSPSSLQGELLANVGAAVYTNPSLLHEATSGSTGLTVSVVGATNPILSITASTAFVSPAIVEVTVSDGSKTDSVRFLVSPQAIAVTDVATTASALPDLAASDSAASDRALPDWQLQPAAVSLAVFGDPEVAAAIPNSALQPAHASDVNADGQVTSLDALLVINFLARTAEMERPAAIVDSILAGGPIFDVSGDGDVTAIDALRVINDIARQPAVRLGDDSQWQDGVDSALTASKQ